MRCINYLSEYLVPVVLFYIVGFAVLQKRPVFDDFIEGALAGLKTCLLYTSPSPRDVT